MVLPDIRPGLDNIQRSKKVMECHGWSFPITGLTFQVRKVMGGVGECVACRIIVSDPVPVSFLWTLDLGPGFGTGLGLDNYINDLIIVQ